MAILGIHHAAIIVPDITAGLAFYRDVLGFNLVEDADIEPSEEAEAITGLPEPRAKSVILKSSWGYLELFEYLHPKPEKTDTFDIKTNAIGIRHLCLAVDDCRAEYDRLSEAMSFHCEPKNLGWTKDGDGPWVTYGRDPFGNILELWQLTPDDPQLYAPIPAQYPSWKIKRSICPSRKN